MRAVGLSQHQTLSRVSLTPTLSRDAGEGVQCIVRWRLAPDEGGGAIAAPNTFARLPHPNPLPRCERGSSMHRGDALYSNPFENNTPGASTSCRSVAPLSQSALPSPLPSMGAGLPRT